MKKHLIWLLLTPLVASCQAEAPSAAANIAVDATPAPSSKPSSAQSTDKQSGKSIKDEKKPAMNTVIPAGFSAYESEPISGGRRCIAGAAVDEDGMNQKPVVYVEESSGRTLWSETLQLPTDTFQGRATHCLQNGNSLYVLMQSDTQPEQTLSQTLLRVLKIRADDGAIETTADNVGPTGISDAYSAWVEEGANNFRWEGGALVVSGMYYRLALPDERKAFQESLSSSLTK